MQTTEKRVNRKGRSAFTLVELMVVVAIISILIGGVFKLLGAAGEKSKESVTVSRMEKLQNALSGYYAEFGSYPPVMQFECPDPDLQRKSADRTKFEPAEGQPWEKANRAAHSQSVVYEFPTVRGLDPFIDLVFKGTARSAGIAFAGSAIKSDSWYSVQVFKYGLLSYLLPRAHIAWGTEARYEDLFKSPQWTGRPSLPPEGIDYLINQQLEDENHTVARWLPNFEKIICGGSTVMGIDLAEKDTGVTFSSIYNPAAGGMPYVVQKMTIRDGWNNEFYYYSAAPYQSYRIWSSGKDGKTFPPWIPIDKVKPLYDQAATWIADDIVRFDH